MEQKRKWKISDIWEILKNGFAAIVTGNLLLRLNAGRYFIHIAYTFLLFWILIFESLMAENALSKVERNMPGSMRWRLSMPTRPSRWHP